MLYDCVRDITKTDDKSVRMNTQDELSDFSSQSVLCDMNKFIKTVNNMNETVMVPSRLLDIEIKSNSKVPVMLRGGGDPYTFFNVINSVKNDLIWGPTSNDDEDDHDDLSSSSSSSAINSGTSWSDPSTPTSTNNNHKRHVRRQSTLSNISMNSSDIESDSSNVSEGGDSGCDTEDSTEAVTATLRNHLVGLQTCLAHLTNTASYITERYQEEVNM